MRAKFIVETDDGLSKEKKFALKIFNSLSKKRCFDEFYCHTKIIELVKRNSKILESLNILPGTGIEKKPIHALSQGLNRCMIKKNYDTDLEKAIGDGCFEDTKLLLLGSNQLLEGMITLMTIGALYFDIKPDNILVGRKGKFEMAFCDFEGVSFLEFNKNDDKIIKNTFIRMIDYIAHDHELSNLFEIQKNEKPAKEFIEKLHKLYVYMLGALFFSMATSFDLKSFILWSLKINKISSTPPEINFLRMENVQKALRDQMLKSKVPTFYADLVISMINPDAEERINIYDALQVLRTGGHSSKRDSEEAGMFSEAQASEQPVIAIKKRAKAFDESKRDETELDSNKCRKTFHMVLRDKKAVDYKKMA
jgi:serine/threonine protein kinase